MNSSSKTSPPPNLGPLDENLWHAYVKIGAFWHALAPEDRRKVLAGPRLMVSGYIGSRHKKLEHHPKEMAALLRAHGIPQDSESHYLVLRLMQICHALGPVHEPPGQATEKLAANLVAHVLPREIAEAYAKERSFGWSYHTNKPPVLDLSRLTGAGRLRRLLAIPAGGNGIEWEKAAVNHAEVDFPKLLTGTHVVTFARLLLQTLVDHGSPMPLRELLGRVAYDHAKQSLLIAKAIRSLVWHMLVVVDYDTAAEGPRIGLWQGVLEKYQRSATKTPPSAYTGAAPEKTFCSAVLSDDLDVVLAEAARAPLPVKADGTNDIFAANARRIGALLEPIPEWVDLGGYLNTLNRTLSAVSLGVTAGFLKLVDHRHILLSQSGSEHLARNPAERRKAVMDWFQSRRAGGRSVPEWNFSANHGDFITDMTSRIILAADDAMAAAWLRMPESKWFPLDTWLDHLVDDNNPIGQAIGADRACYICRNDMWGSKVKPIYGDDVGPEARQWIERFAFTRLAVVGGLEFGRAGKGRCLIRLTDVGRYFLGQTDTYPERLDQAQGKVVVQPNFEIVFLGPNLLARATIARFAEELAPESTTGTLFRITKASIQNHLHQFKHSASAETIIDCLRTAGAGVNPPANVVSEIESWAAARREYSTRPAVAMTLPDKTSTTLAHGILKAYSTVVNDTTLLLDQEITTADKKKLAKAGIFPAYSGALMQKRR